VPTIVPPFRVLLDNEQILRRIAELARRIWRDLYHDPPVLVAVIEGARTFARQLQRELPGALPVHEIRASSYGSGTVSGGSVHVDGELPTPIAGRTVLLLEDQGEREGAHRAGLVQVDVQRLAVPVGQAEEQVERAHRVAVDGAGVQAAEHVGAGGQGGVQQFRRARPAEQARLREGHRLDLLPGRQRCLRALHAFEVPQAGLGVDVDVGADARGAGGQEGARQRHRLRGRVVAAGGAEGTLVVDPVDQARADLVAVPGQAPERLVQVRVAFHQARQQQGAAARFHLRAGRRGQA